MVVVVVGSSPKIGFLFSGASPSVGPTNEERKGGDGAIINFQLIVYLLRNNNQHTRTHFLAQLQLQQQQQPVEVELEVAQLADKSPSSKLSHPIDPRRS